MAAFMFHMELMSFSDEMMETIPKHRERVNEMFAEGNLLSYSVSVNRDEIWCVISAADESEAMELAATFPLSPYFIDVTCTTLLFHNTVTADLPGISLN